jgi:TM2 domain-containing membrane protein YozV
MTSCKRWQKRKVVAAWSRGYDKQMLRSLGKFLQILALVILPVAMVIQLTREMRATTEVTNLSVMLIFLVFGAVMFGLGRIIEGYAR